MNVFAGKCSSWDIINFIPLIIAQLHCLFWWNLLVMSPFDRLDCAALLWRLLVFSANWKRIFPVHRHKMLSRNDVCVSLIMIILSAVSVFSLSTWLSDLLGSLENWVNLADERAQLWHGLFDSFQLRQHVLKASKHQIGNYFSHRFFPWEIQCARITRELNRFFRAQQLEWKLFPKQMPYRRRLIDLIFSNVYQL